MPSEPSCSCRRRPSWTSWNPFRDENLFSDGRILDPSVPTPTSSFAPPSFSDLWSAKILTEMRRTWLLASAASAFPDLVFQSLRTGSGSCLVAPSCPSSDRASLLACPRCLHPSRPRPSLLLPVTRLSPFSPSSFSCLSACSFSHPLHRSHPLQAQAPSAFASWRLEMPESALSDWPLRHPHPRPSCSERPCLSQQAVAT
mmetsp:Transcript_35523/g.64195  ORF Transcript_35523/g.64195 Transcript_35523/m.64195 type:complete len:200 (-) Transcript_35523:308-907(-)